MHKVVIIDDEPMVCRSLAENFAWKEWNCTVSGTALNGLEGKGLIDRIKPEFVLTDVKMPGMNGLEVAEYVSRNYPNTIIIVLSGFNEFDYVREAMRHNVFDYLLKPIDKEELKKTLRRALYHLNKALETSRDAEIIEKKLNQANPLAESGIIMNLMLNNALETESLQNQMQGLGMAFQKGQVVAFDLLRVWEGHRNYQSLSHFALSNILYEVYEQLNCLVSIQWILGKCFIAVLFDLSVPSTIAQKRVLEATRVGIEQAEIFFKKRIFVGMGDFVNQIENLNKSYQSALLRLEHHLFWSLEFSDGLTSLDGSSVRIDKSLYEAMNEGNEAQAMQEFDSLVKRLHNSGNMELVYSLCLEVLVNISNMTKSWELELTVPTLNDLKQYASFDELAVNLREVLSSVCRDIGKRREFIKFPLMDKILSYVKDHFSNPDLSLQDVADNFHLSLSHLSRMFKKETGTNFNDYRSQIRIEKAKELLDTKDWLTSQETAFLVGFMDGKYFSQVFRKYCGMTPSEYRDLKNSTK
ncbi:response regulator transcription factor [Paenibacillus agricola]|uniref:Response regulator n=1 Tax=Paenibacillus agricola TaxID=2716264 RepID=A0ABX0JG65_9BACL|nr:response regulator [Paenibacillus agricola]NHN34913.1 response regulator [Paenibacillus agricola]